ncbi:DHA2 family efflux MFS transporter permease subunit [Formicincola oecophyllae]|uniref:DHA2 family efflux MFS transporter permease subunit n=2 Tax=Formicincola oecophyllae TaxID=2558361 RepID=A0A4Y6U9Y9_9PROT|nr:DHA2 family efflux MFS transporter permease subunit [Formicincola oecophyllae]
MAAFMEVLDTTIVNVALPHIAGALGCSYDDATWALTSYLVANGIVLTISGWLSRTFGRKRYFMICISMFTLTSFCCGLSQSLGMLVIFRLLQGFFGGGLQPCQQSIILDIFPPDKRGAAFGLSAIATIVGPVLGPLLGGWLTDNYSWHWVFFVNVPFGIITTALVAGILEDPPWEKARKSRIDVIGISLISLGLGCVEIMADRGEDDDWFSSGFIITMALIGFSCTIAAIIWLLKSKNPLLRLSVLKDRNFAVGTVLVGAMGMILYAGAVIVPQFAQQVQGYTATLAGMLLAPGGVVIICLIPFVGKLMGKVELRYIIAFGFMFMATSLFYSSQLYTGTSFGWLVKCRLLQSAPLAFLFVPISTLAFMTLPDELNADGSALFAMVRNYLGSQAISYSGAGLTEARQLHQDQLGTATAPWRVAMRQYIQDVDKVAQWHGFAPLRAKSYAVAHMYQDFQVQVSMLAYNEVFQILGMLALSVVPLCFLASPGPRSGGPAKGGH